jgi:hypothetical protein
MYTRTNINLLTVIDPAIDPAGCSAAAAAREQGHTTQDTQVDIHHFTITH